MRKFASQTAAYASQHIGDGQGRVASLFEESGGPQVCREVYALLPQISTAIKGPFITKDLWQSAGNDNFDCVPGVQARQLDVALHGGIGDSHSADQTEPRACEFD